MVSVNVVVHTQFIPKFVGPTVWWYLGDLHRKACTTPVREREERERRERGEREREREGEVFN